MISAKDVFQQLTKGPGIMDSVCDFIIRPPRSVYEMVDLGPEVFRIGDNSKQRFTRHDFELESMRGLRFQCSWFKPYPPQRVPCVVYCHANCGSRYDALEALFVLQEGMSLFSFDFCGSGMSEGEYISLGFYERQDLAAVMEFLMFKSDEVDGVALWGRSMGAVTSIMYASKDPWIRCIVCDSPFATLRVLINDLVERHGGRTARVIPNAVLNAIVGRIRKRIMKRASFDIDDLDTVKYARMCRVPALLFYGSEDDFVTSKHCELIRDAFPIPCLQQYTPGGHNDERDESIQKIIAAFLHLYLIDKPAGKRELCANQEQQQQEQAVQAAVAAEAIVASSPSPPPAAAASSAAASPSNARNSTSNNRDRPPKNISTVQPPIKTASFSSMSSSSSDSNTSPEPRPRLCAVQDSSSLPAIGAVKSAGSDTALKPTVEVIAAQVATPGSGGSPSTDIRKDELSTLPELHNKFPSSIAGSHDISNSGSNNNNKDAASLPQLHTALPPRPTPAFSATEVEPRVTQSVSPVMTSRHESRGV